MRRFLFGLALVLVSSLAAAQTPPPPPWPGLGVPTNVDSATLTATANITINGAATTVVIPWAAFLDVLYQFNQARGWADQVQTQGQWAVPTCVMATPFVSGSTQSIFDWSQYKLRSSLDGAIFNVRPDTGAVYRNGQRLGSNFVQKLCLFGSDLLGKGKTDNLWWRWSGVTTANKSGWTAVTTDVDPNSIN